MGERRRGSSQLSTPVKPQRRVDASMSILVDLMQHAIDDGYAASADRKRVSNPDPDATLERIPSADATPPAAAGKHADRVGAVTAIVLLAAAGALFATSAVQSHRGAATARKQQQQLVQRVATQTTSTNALATQDQQLRDQLTATRAKALAGANSGVQLQATIDGLELAVGGVAVSGPGVRVVLDDSTDNSSSSLGVIYDTDLQAVVNALWSSGAEAVAVNGQRLSALSSIREAGDAILVNYRPLEPPYTVDAIGAPATLQSAFSATETAHLYTTWSQIYGLGFTVAGQSRLTLPSAANLTVTAAKPLDSP
jgi:uncharacterized protein YlxW (UPF0749 family)